MKDILHVARPFGFVVLGALAVAAWFAMAPAPSGDAADLPSAAQYERLISQALSDNEANDARTDTAPQQQVVNGWVARDLLTIIARANADLLEASGALAEGNSAALSSRFDQRIPALLVLVVLALAWDGLTRGNATRIAAAESMVASA